MSKSNLLLIGAGGHAKACLEIIESTGIYSVASIVGLESELGQNVLGYSVIHTDNELENLQKEYEYAFIAIGQIQNSESRVRMHSRLIKLGFKLPTIVSSSAQVSRSVEIGIGTIVMNGAILNADCKIGENVIINTASVLEHDVTIGNHCHVSTRVVVNGGTKIGRGTFLGSGSVVRNGIEIGENSFVGMGSIITSSLPSDSRYKEKF